MFIGKIILNRRKELGMTQKELAEKLNVTDRTISRWECEVSLPDVEMLKTLSQVLDVDISYFYEDVPVREINYTEEYDYEKIKKYKLNFIAPFILLVASMVITLIAKSVIWEITFPLLLISNHRYMIYHAYESGIMHSVYVMEMILMASFILIVASFCLCLRNNIVFRCFYKEKMFRAAYVEAYKKINIPYLILFGLSIIFIII